MFVNILTEKISRVNFFYTEFSRKEDKIDSQNRQQNFSFHEMEVRYCKSFFPAQYECPSQTEYNDV